MSIVRYSNFKPDPWGNGAEKRTAQLAELLESYSESIVELSSMKMPKKHGRIESYLTGYRYLSGMGLPLKSRLHVGQTGLKVRNLLDGISEHDLVLWEYSRYSNNYLPYVARQCGIPLIGLPHNLESLVPTQRSLASGRKGLEWLNEEFRLLKDCDVIFTISEEEEWLLKLSDANAYCLPYYPVRVVEKQLFDIRERRRQSTTGDFFLLLGTVLNPPTKHGFVELIQYFNECVHGKKLVVVGFATETLMDDLGIRGSNVEILGGVDKERLEDLLVTCKALIVNQKPSSGALTKLQEMRIAGVPVIGNKLSFRSYSNISGFYSFFDYSDLNELLQLDEYEIPETPKRNIMAEGKFKKTVEEFLK